MFETLKNEYPFPSKRNTVYAKNGVVATSQPLAAEAGLSILRKGGNAVDAAIATAACLTVVEPTSNGIGGDAFAIVWMNQKLNGLNASGYSPYALTKSELIKRGINSIPRFGFVPVMVPGVPKAWATLSKTYGKLSLLECLEPAIDYARNGFVVSEEVAKNWQNAVKIYQKLLQGDEYISFFDTFTQNDRSPIVGELFVLKDHANTLESIGKTASDSFYKGEIAEKIDAYSKKFNGFIRKKDLEDYEVNFVKPIQIHYKGYDICEIPPNGQGIVALEALKIMSHFSIDESPMDKVIHQQIESIKIAFSDAFKHVSDKEATDFDYRALLTDEYTLKRSRDISENAINQKDIIPYGSGTVYLATADKDGNMVSYIQSNYMGFGSGLVVPNTGIALQNRGHNFSFEDGHPNEVGPHKRSYHTIIPGFIMKANEAIGPFGVMGGFMQPQGHLQVVMNLIDFHFNPQSALDAPRWQWMEEDLITVEDKMDQRIINNLIKRGHKIKILSEYSGFGRGQMIIKNKQGVYAVGTENRCDGHISCY